MVFHVRAVSMRVLMVSDTAFSVARVVALGDPLRAAPPMPAVERVIPLAVEMMTLSASPAPGRFALISPLAALTAEEMSPAMSLSDLVVSAMPVAVLTRMCSSPF